jgi:hypothetical protein
MCHDPGGRVGTVRAEPADSESALPPERRSGRLGSILKGSESRETQA